MKLRLKGDSLRLRVARSELARLAAGESIVECVHLAPGPAGTLRYMLAVDPQSLAAAVCFVNCEIQVRLSRQQFACWNDEAETGIYVSLHIEGSKTLDLVVEKDFACLDRREEENADTFAHPTADGIC